MTIEDQLSWFMDSDSQVAKALATNTRELLALRASIDRIKTDQSQIMHTLGLAMPGGIATPDLISVTSFQKSDRLKPISAELSPRLLLLFHRLTCFDLPTRAVGQLRTDQVWLANREGRRVTHIEPPPATEVRDRLEELCNQWNSAYPGLSDSSTKLTAIAKFHARFLLIHPFFDGNGRVARAILMQQCLDLFTRADMTLMNKGADYYMALQSADAGDYAGLVALINPIVHG
jgi:Fic family protein